MPKLIIFDLDGTLLDTIEDLANSVNYALQQYNLPTHEVDAYRFFVGNGVDKLLERALPADKQNADMLSMLKMEFLKHYYSHTDDSTKPYPGLANLLSTLYAKGYQLAIASNKVHPATVELAARFFPDVKFTAVFGQREGYPAKPNAGILEEIISLANVAKSEVLYVGDSGVDALTASNAQVPFVGVLWGFRPRVELEAFGAELFVANAHELLELIRN
ncbi:MAG: phosphoglycolate phosphatase [Porphyromonadaceae bacterium CG2_30_38_12]|nr:MAG: phosphoglycolate phosphatase [Porphyromonadaceae bacterium CG2_30_38_12]